MVAHTTRTDGNACHKRGAGIVTKGYTGRGCSVEDAEAPREGGPQCKASRPNSNVEARVHCARQAPRPAPASVSGRLSALGSTL